MSRLPHERMESHPWKLRNARTESIVVERLIVADRFWSRLRGLQFRRFLPLDAGLLLIPCRSIHTAFCYFPIDVFGLDRDGRVTDARRNVLPWSTVVMPGSVHAVLEMASRQSAALPADIEGGDVLSLFRPSKETSIPASLRFLASERLD